MCDNEFPDARMSTVAEWANSPEQRLTQIPFRQGRVECRTRNRATGPSVSEPEATTTTHVARRAVILSGAGRFADQWHDFAATSARIAGILSDAGFETEIAENVDERMADL